MSGPRILLGVLALTGLLLWAALAGGGDADLERGLEQTDRAFAAVEAELSGLDADFRALAAQGPVLALREEHTRVRDLLLGLRSERVALESDDALDRRARLPALRDLVDRADEALALAVALRRKCSALADLRRDAAPRVATARTLQERLEGAPPPDAATATRISQHASTLAELSQRVELAEQIIRQNVEQGRQFGEQTLAALDRLVQDQRALLDAR